jgi:O-antigen ligase
MTAERLLILVLVGVLAGYSCLPNAWFHTAWLALGGLMCARRLELPPFRAFWPAWAFLGWMTLRSVFSASAGLGEGLPGLALLMLALLLFFNAARNSKVMRLTAVWTGHLSALAAVISLGWHLRQFGTNFEDYRLQNLLVHGGLNAVCTGLIFGFCGLWLCVMPLTRLTALSSLVLTTAAFCSGSRGAMLSLLAGHVVLLAVRGLKGGWRPVLILLTAGGLFSLSGVLVKRPEATPAAGHSISQPMTRAITRPTEGRMDIYKAGWSSLDTPLDHVIGIGQWGTQERWKQHLPPDPSNLCGHLHSAFLATYVHGGLIGAALLLVLITRLAGRAWHRLRSGDPAWPVMLAAGMAALVFDGESFGTLLTLPRFETLLFWLPAAALLTDEARQSGA